MKYELTKHEDRDHMPREVAVLLLTDPKGKLNARMRKNCMLALQKVAPSAQPHQLAVDNKEDGFFLLPRSAIVFNSDVSEVVPHCRMRKSLVRIIDVEHKPKPVEQQMAEFVKRFSFERLRRLVIRCARRFVRVERALAKAERVLKVPYILNAIRSDFRARLDMLQEMGDAAANEMKIRRAFENE